MFAVAESTDLLYRAIRAIATACDGSRTLDGAGFTKFDAEFGHKMAVLSFDRWTDKQKRAIWFMLRKYRKQLDGYGIDYSAIPEPRVKEQWRPSGVAPLHSRRIESIETGGFRVLFDYDSVLVGQVKKIPGAKWNWENKTWSVPASPVNAEVLLSFAQRNQFIAKPMVHQALMDLAGQAHTAKMNLEASRAIDADFKVEGLGGTLRGFQRAGVAYATKAERCFIADEMGLGKTIQALASIQHWQAFPAIVVCPASLKLNWVREGYRWIPGRSVKMWDSKRGWPADINVINYDILERRLDVLKSLNAKAIVFDEAHKLKNRSALRTVAATDLAAGIRYRLALTGTPILNRPNEIVAQLRILGRLEQLGGEKGFPKRISARLLQELNDRLRASCYIRRMKSEVLTELPAKQRSIIPVPIDNREEYERAERELIAWLKDQALQDKEFEASLAALTDEERAAKRKEKAEDVAARAERAQQLVRINALKKLAVRGKMGEVTKWVRDFLESGEKLVLFAHHVDVVLELGRLFNAPTITGQTELSARQAAVDRFQTDEKCRAIALNLEAGGVGLTLTAASNVAFVELGWTPALHDQAEDRCHRIGQQFQVNAWYLLGEKTIDEDIQDLIDEKRKVVTAATDGKILKQEHGVVGDLVNRLTRRD